MSYDLDFEIEADKSGMVELFLTPGAKYLVSKISGPR